VTNRTLEGSPFDLDILFEDINVITNTQKDNTVNGIIYEISERYNRIQANYTVSDFLTAVDSNAATKKIYVGSDLSNSIYMYHTDGRDLIPVKTIKLDDLVSISDIIVNNQTNMIYVITPGSDTIPMIDGYTDQIAAKVKLRMGAHSAAAVNENTNMIYVTDRISDTVYIINGTTNKVEKEIIVGDQPRGIAVNQVTNKIYVANSFSGTVSVINGTTKNVIAGVTFKTNPLEAGFIECNGKETSSNYTIYDTDTRLECEAIPNSGFQFSSWSGDLVAPTSNIRAQSKFTVSDYLFGSWFNSNDNDAKTTVTVSKYGTLAANFIRPVEVSIPTEALLGIILSPIIGWMIPFIANRYREDKQREKLDQYMMKNINDELDKPYQNKVEYQNRLNELRKKIQEMYIERKISESYYEVLNNKISEYDYNASKS
jgi:YVTN family beta-propeller protein